MFKRIANFIVLSMLLVSSGIASTYEKQLACKNLLIQEFKNSLSRDNGLIQAQLTLTAMKLAQKVLKRSGLRSQTIEAYTESIIGNKTLERLNADSNIQSEILDTFNKYSGKKKYLDANAELIRLKNSEKISDEDISKLMIELQTTWKKKDGFGFDEKDFAFTWFINKANFNSTGENSYLISNTIKQLLDGVTESPEKFRNIEKQITENFKNAQLQLKAEIQKVKAKVFEKHKKTCLNYFGTNEKDQNTSIYENATCDMQEEKVLEDSLLEAIGDVLNHENLSGKKIAILNSNSKEVKDSDKRRGLQDKINALPTNKERILEFYKNNLSKNDCDGFLIIDKKKNTTALYLNNGDEVFSSKSIIGTGKMNEYKEFHPDSVLRKWNVKNAEGENLKTESGKYIYKYTRTTGAGTYFMDKSLSKEERAKRQYDKEFNDRVMVLYSKKKDGQREEVQAVHGVPNIGWIKNRDSRMNAFDDKNAAMNLSTGCVNLEGYTYDIMNQFIGNNCPMYILPEDKSNHFYLKNGELNFSTDNKKRKSDKEHSKMNLSDGEQVEDPQNYNQFNFTPLNKENAIQNYKTVNGTSSSVIDEILKSKAELYRRAVQIENDDFEDISSLVYALTNEKEKASDLFIDLYNSFYHSDIKDMMSSREKKKKILEFYKNEFKQDFNEKEIIEKSNEVIYEY